MGDGPSGFGTTRIVRRRKRVKRNNSLESVFASAMKGSGSAVEFWMNMTDEQKERFQESGLTIYELYDKLKDKVDTSTPEWKPANPGGVDDFAIQHDFSSNTVDFVLIQPKSPGWQADADNTGIVEVRSDGIEGDWRQVIAHELGHQLSNMVPKLASTILTNPGNVLGRYNMKLMAFDGLSYSPEESWADAVGYYFADRSWLMEKHPQEYKAVKAFFQKSPSAQKYIEDALKKYKRIAGLQ